MFCPKCGSNQGDRRFCTSCGTNLAAVTQALTSPLAFDYAAQNGNVPVNYAYEIERQRQYSKGMKFLLIGGAFFGYSMLRFIFSFGDDGLGFGAFLGMVLFAYGLSQIISWKQTANRLAASPPDPLVQHTLSPQRFTAPTPHTAQLQMATPQPVFAPPAPGTPTGELAQADPVPAVPLGSVIEADTLQLPNKQMEPHA